MELNKLKSFIAPLTLTSMLATSQVFANTDNSNKIEFGYSGNMEISKSCEKQYNNSRDFFIPFGNNFNNSAEGFGKAKKVIACIADGDVKANASSRFLNSLSKPSPKLKMKYPKLEGDSVPNGRYNIDVYNFNMKNIGTTPDSNDKKITSICVDSKDGNFSYCNGENHDLFNSTFRDDDTRAYHYAYSKIGETPVSRNQTSNINLQQGQNLTGSNNTQNSKGKQNSENNNYNNTNGYNFDINSDGYIDNLKSDANGLTTKISYGNSKDSDNITNEAVRQQILRAIKYDGHSQDFDSEEIVALSNSTGSTNFYVPRLTGEGMTIGDQAEDVLSYMIDTNNTAGNNTKVKNALGFTGLVDKIARAKVTGEYKVAHFLKNEDNSFRTFHDEKSDDLEDVYRDSFGQSTSVLGYGAHIFGSSIIEMIQHDYNPSRSQNKQLVRGLGGNLESFVGQFNAAENYGELGNVSQKVLDTQVDFYKGQVNATATKIGGLKEW